MDGELRFAFPEPDYFDRFRALVPVPVLFDCAYHQMRFPAERLDQRLRFADPRLARMAEAQCEQELASIKSPPKLLGQVRRLVLGEAGRFPSVEEAASELHMSSRTLKRKLQQLGALAAENVRLRQLLNSAKIISDRVLVAELISVSPDPLIHSVTLNKGSADGVYAGQPLLDAHGLMGQVTEVGEFQSRALLITDATHALPVQVNRNGVRAIIEGVGDLYRLDLRHLANTVDIREGDLLVSSGLGQRFPVGYPVAEVVSVERDPGQPFAQVQVRPKAQLNRSRHVLLVFSETEYQRSRVQDSGTGQTP